MNTNDADVTDAFTRKTLQHVLINKIQELPVRRLKAVKVYVGWIKQLGEGYELTP